MYQLTAFDLGVLSLRKEAAAPSDKSFEDIIGAYTSPTTGGGSSDYVGGAFKRKHKEGPQRQLPGIMAELQERRKKDEEAFNLLKAMDPPAPAKPSPVKINLRALRALNLKR